MMMMIMMIYVRTWSRPTESGIGVGHKGRHLLRTEFRLGDQKLCRPPKLCEEALGIWKDYNRVKYNAPSYILGHHFTALTTCGFKKIADRKHVNNCAQTTLTELRSFASL
jgi:hypothetical protein